MLQQNRNISFNENDFIEIITKYNSSKGFESKDLREKKVIVKHLIANVGGGFRNHETEYFIQAIFRQYNPKISRSTSLNIGINYFNHQSLVFNDNYTQSLISAPVYIQHNLLNKNIRPYFFGGLSVNYYKITDNENIALVEEGLQTTFGLNLLFGVGLELDIYKAFFIKSEIRQETFFHLIQLGVGYNFSGKN